MRNIRTFKNLFLLMLMALVAIVVVGCGGTKIELSFDQPSYTVEVGKELTLTPTVKNEDDEDYTLVYSSETPTIATYEAGKVKGVAAGETKVKVSLEGNDKVFAEATIIVESPAEVKTFKVTFNVDGGSAVAAVTVDDGAKVAKPADPTKDGFLFKGWFTDAAKTKSYDFNAAVKGELTLYAKWEEILPDTFTVTFNTDGGSDVAPVQVEDGANVEKPADPTKDGFVFVGWFTDESLENSFDFETEVITEDITLYAKWTETFEVTFNSNGGSEVDSAQVEDGQKVTKPADPTKDGFVFVGWFTDDQFTTEYDFDLVVEADLALYAKWEEEVKEYTIAYEFNEGSLSDVYLEESRNQMIEDFLTDFYEFLEITDIDLVTFMHGVDKTSGWDGSYNSTTNFPQLYSANNRTINASTGKFINQPEYNPKWLPLFDLIEIYTKSNPDQSFWGSPDPVGINRLKPFFQKRNLWGSWIDLETFNWSIKHVPEEYLSYTTLVVGDEDIVLPEIFKEGYSFEGWFTDEELTVEFDAEAAVTSNLTLYAKWALQEYDLTLNFDGGLKFKDKNDMIEQFLTDFYAYVSPTESLSDFMHGAGKTEGFAGTWHATHKARIYSGTRPEAVNEEFFISSALYMEKWLPFFDMMDEFVKFNPAQSFWGGTWTGLARIDQYIRNVKPAADWTDEYMAMMPEAPVTEVIKFTVESEITLPTIYKENHTFLGWFDNANFEGEAITKLEKGTDKNITLYAKWEADVVVEKHTVTFDVDGGTAIDPVEVENGTVVAKPADPTKDGFTFVGWFTDAAKTTEYVFTTEVTADLTLYAKWEEVPQPANVADVSTYAELVAALENEEITVINLLADITADAKLVLARDGVTINGNNHTLTFVSAEGWQGDYILHVYKAQNVVVKDIKFDGGDAALLVNGATVKLEGNITLSNHEFGGIEVSLGVDVTTNLQLELADGVVLTFAEEAYGTPAIWEDIVTDKVLGAEALFTSTTVKETQVQYYLVEANSVAPEVVQTVAEVRNATEGDLVITKGVVTALVGNNAFIQDATAGVYLYLGNNASFAGQLVVGNEVKVYGKLAVYNGLVQLSTITDVSVLQTEQTLPEAVVLTELVLDDVAAQQGKLVSIEGLTIKTIPTLGTGHISVTLTNGTVDIVLYTYSYSAAHADVKALFEGAVEGQGLNLVAIPVGAFNNTQFIVTDINQLILQELTPAQIEAVLTTELDPGTDLVADVDLQTTATVGPNNYTVIWTSDNEALISNAGVVVRPAVGEADALVTLTAEVKDGETVVATLVYTVTVKAESGITEPELLYSYNFNDGGSSNNNAYASTGLTTNISFAADNPGGTSGDTEWLADYANLSLTSGTRLGGKLESTEYGSPSANIRTDFTYTNVITKVEMTGATTFGTASNVGDIYLQTSTDGNTWTTVSTKTVSSTITFDELNIESGSYIKIVVQLSASSKNSGLEFTGISVSGYPN